MRSTARHFKPTILSLATAYDDQSGSSELVIPENFDDMEYSSLTELRSSAIEAFNALYEGISAGLTDAENQTLAELTEGIEALSAEITKRDTATAERVEAAAELAARVKTASGEGEAEGDESGESFATETDEDASKDEGDAENSDGDAPEADADEQPEASEEAPEGEAEATAKDSEEALVAAGGSKRAELRVPLSNVKRKSTPTPPQKVQTSMKDIAFASGDAGTGFSAGEGVDFTDIGTAIDRKLTSYNSGQYRQAHSAGRALREQHGIATFSRKFAKDAIVDSTDRESVDRAIAYAVDESRLPQGGLVAAGGWCAPSETMYDLLELETRAGMLSIPEIGITRGGIQLTPGPDFASIYEQFPGFKFTEQEDIDGKYQTGSPDNVVGPKPSVRVECPEFVDYRLEGAGLSIQAGLLQARGYPEVIARTVRGALIAHEHRMNAEMIQRMADGSDEVNVPARNAGATAPILEAIELQATHYRYRHRLADTATLEAVFPMWLRGAMRADLARREGIEVFEVSDQRLNSWLAARQIAPQFVYNWQGIDGVDAGTFTAWPDEVQFLLYAAGTWLRGSSPIITLDTIYDSTLLHDNDYTALFTEEGWLVAKRGTDSRVVTVPLCYDGGVAQAIALDCAGTRVAEAAGGGE